MNHTASDCQVNVRVNGFPAGAYVVTGRGFIIVDRLLSGLRLKFNPQSTNSKEGLVEAWFTDENGSTIYIYQRIVDQIPQYELQLLSRDTALTEGGLQIATY